MNPAQTNATLRAFLTAVCPLMAALGVLHADQVGPLIEAIMLIVGTVAPIGSWLWSLWEKTHHNQAQAAVEAIKARPTLETVGPIAAALRDVGADVRLTALPTNAELAASRS